MKKQLKFYFLFSGIVLLLVQCTKPSTPSTNTLGTVFIPASDSNFLYVGRIDKSIPSSVRFAYSGVAIRFKFEGSTCVVHIKNNSVGRDKEGVLFKNYYNVIIDNKSPQVYAVSNEEEKIVIKGISKGTHEVELFKRTEALVGEGVFEGIDIDKEGKMLVFSSKKNRKMEFIGNSITCGYGNEGASKDCSFSPETENGYMAYGAITARNLNAEYTAVAYSGKGIFRNYDGATVNTMSLIYDRIFPDNPTSLKWDTKSNQPDVIVLNLGTNDFAKGVPDSLVFINTYVNFLKRLRSYYPKAKIVCIEGPMMNDSYPVGANAFTKVKNFIQASVDKLKSKGEQDVYTFFPSTQGEGDYGCDWHPNVSRQEKMAAELSKEIKSIMKW